MRNSQCNVCNGVRVQVAKTQFQILKVSVFFPPFDTLFAIFGQGMTKRRFAGTVGVQCRRVGFQNSIVEGSNIIFDLEHCNT